MPGCAVHHRLSKTSFPVTLRRTLGGATFPTSARRGDERTPPRRGAKEPKQFAQAIFKPTVPTIPKRDRRRPWKTKPKGTKPRRAFHCDGTPVRPFDGVPTGSDLDPRLKTARWQRLRARVIQAFPLCPICDCMGRTTPTTECDHISPRQRGRFDLFDLSNLWALCSDCHAVKSQLERNGVDHDSPEDWASHVARIRNKGG